MKPHYFLCWLLIGIVLSTPLLAEDRALLIGINLYETVGRDLRGSVNDAEQMRLFAINELKFRKDQVKLLLNEEATRKQIMDALDNWLAAGTHAGDRVLFYYSGHGYFQPDTSGDEQDRVDETLVSYDTVVKQDKSIANMITDDEIGGFLQKLDDRRVVVMIDSCHSGTMSRDLQAQTENHISKTPVFMHKKTGPGLKGLSRASREEVSFIKGSASRMVWSAVSAVQSALENNEISPMNGVFTNAFLNGVQKKLADQNNNGVVTNSELLEYVQAESKSFCKRHPTQCQLGLTPSLETTSAALAAPVFSCFGYAQHNTSSPPGQAATDILAHSNESQIALDILPSDRIQLKETLRFKVSSPVDGYLIVLDINANNEVTQIFPNRFSDAAGQANKIYSHKSVVIPNSFYGFELKAAEPVGDSLLLAIVTEDPVELGDLLNMSKDLQVISNSNAYLADLAMRLRETWHQDEHNRQLRWSLVEKPYHIFR